MQQGPDTYKLWAKNSTCERVVHPMPLDTDEWKARREFLRLLGLTPAKREP